MKCQICRLELGPQCAIPRPPAAVKVRKGYPIGTATADLIRTVHPCAALVPVHGRSRAVAMCGLFSDGKMQYAPSTAVNSSEGAVTVRPHPEKWWAQWWMSASWSWRPDPCWCALCSLWSFGHQLKGDALSILALNAFPNLAPRKRQKQPRPPVRQTHKTSREEGAVGRQQLTSSP